MKFGMGQSVKRTEDLRLVTGQGQYTDDLTLPNQAHAWFVRSPHAHAKLGSIDTADARQAPGVIAVLTFEDIEKLNPGRLIALAPVQGKGGKGPAEAEQPFLARDKVRWVGEAIAMVIAETAAQAKDAGELVMIDYDPLDAVGTLEAVERGQGIALWDSAPDNVALDWEAGDEAGVKAAFAKAAHTASIEIVQNRIVCNAMETRAANAVHDPSTDSYTIYTSTQGVAGFRARVSAFLRHDPAKIHMITRDVGGGFGMKNFVYPEQLLCPLAAKIVGRPVKWTGERSEAFTGDAAGRDMRTRAEAALDAEGRLLGLRIVGSGNLGAYHSQFGVFIPTLAGSRVFGGVYRIPAVYANIKCYFTNTGPVDAYRGAGRPEAAYLMERLMDQCARVMGVDRIEIRKRNLLTQGELPYTNWAGIPFDSGDFAGNLDTALGLAGFADFETRRAEAAKHGKLRGLGICYYVEITGGGATEPAAIRFTENGGVEVSLGTQSNGQGHETSFAQILADRLGVPFESITIMQGDSLRDIDGGGTGGSRSAHMSGGAIFSVSDEVVRKGKIAASDVLEAAPADIEFTVSEGAGRFAIAGTDRTISIGELAMEAKRRPIEGLEGGLDSTAAYKGDHNTYPNGAHLCEVEIDPDTGVTRIVRYTVVDDFGKIINPMIVSGQVHGGIVQGLGQALHEDCVYDPESAQLLTGSFMDYGMPRADDMPSFDLHFNESVPCKTNPLGLKGCGEAGTVGALAAVMNAIADAVGPRGITHIDMPATPQRVWQALQDAA
ncbi:MAG: xanthine dehydrogenase family protein molybdopterin-binding subunit [Alphaproteobacteria bacterium]|nr:xanthine dehydrogenase family protein molybdopterin-binding subunit [Alphaproteobacteria bacterium]